MEVRVNNKTLPIFILLLFFCMTFVMSAPPVQQTEILQQGLQVESPIIEYMKIYDNFKFHAHVYNVSNGVLMDNTSVSCMIHVYDSENGGHLIEDNMSFDSNGVDFEYEVDGGNFSKVGQYAILISCQTDGIIETASGGFIEFPISVTMTGEENSVGTFALLLLSLVFLFLLLIWINIKFNQEGREELYKKYVTNYFKINSGDHKVNLGTTILTALAYGILRNLIVFYYLIIVAFMFLMTELVSTFCIQSLIVLFTTILNVVLWGFLLVFIVMIFTLYQVVIKSLHDISKLMQGVSDVF